jgi:hypothetical protein
MFWAYAKHPNKESPELQRVTINTLSSFSPGCSFIKASAEDSERFHQHISITDKHYWEKVNRHHSMSAAGSLEQKLQTHNQGNQVQSYSEHIKCNCHL